MSQFVRGLPKSFGPTVLLLLIACAAASSQEGSQSGAPELGRVRTLLEKGEHDSATKVSRKVIADPATDSVRCFSLVNFSPNIRFSQRLVLRSLASSRERPGLFRRLTIWVLPTFKKATWNKRENTWRVPWNWTLRRLRPTCFWGLRWFVWERHRKVFFNYKGRSGWILIMWSS